MYNYIINGNSEFKKVQSRLKQVNCKRVLVSINNSMHLNICDDITL